MRDALVVAFAVSAALHSGAIAWVRTHPLKKAEAPREVTPQPVEIVTIAPPPDPAPTEVALLDDHTVATAGAAPSTARNTRTRPAVSTSRGATNETAPPVTTDPGKQRHEMMTMRKPDKPKLDATLSSDFMARFMARSPPIIDYGISGTKERLGNPKWIANASPGEIEAERARLIAMRDELANKELKPDGAGTKSEHRTFNIKVNPDGTVASINDGPNLKRQGVGASFDVTDMMMRRQGIDPYSSYKLKVLDETRDERVATGKRYRTQQLAQSRQLMQKNLERLLAREQDPIQLKRGLFELWDDCAETGSEELVVGGRIAREHLVGFIRSRLPADSADAFTTAELVQFNKQRKSRAVFAPYE